MPNSRRGFIALMAAFAATGLSACGKAGAGRNAQQIVVSFSDLSQPFFVSMRHDLEDEAAKLGITVQVLDGQNNSSKQVSDLDAAAIQGIGGVIIAPTDSKALASSVDSLIDQGIAVVSVDRRISGGKHAVPHVGADNVAGGRLMADWVVNTYPNGARIVVITNDPGSASSIERVKGVHEGLSVGGERYQIVAEQTGNSKRDQALTVTQNILTSSGATPPDVILCLNDDMAMGALEAIHSAGLSNRIKVLGFDAIPEALKRIRAGELAATVEQNPGLQIRTALREVVAYLKSKAAIQSDSLTPVLITQDNLNQASRIAEAKS